VKVATPPVSLGALDTLLYAGTPANGGASAEALI
jgi:hypothetical protein